MLNLGFDILSSGTEKRFRVEGRFIGDVMYICIRGVNRYHIILIDTFFDHRFMW